MFCGRQSLICLYLLQAVRGEGCAPSCSPTQIGCKSQKPELALTTRKRVPESGRQWSLPQEQNHRPLCLNIHPPYKHTLVSTGHKRARKRENNPSSVVQNVTYRSSQADCKVRGRGWVIWCENLPFYCMVSEAWSTSQVIPIRETATL